MKFPTTKEEVQAALKRIGIDNIRYEEIFIADYDGRLPELNACLGNMKALTSSTIWPICSLNWTKSGLEKFEAVIDSSEHTLQCGRPYQPCENLDAYEFYPGVEDDETLRPHLCGGYGGY